MKIPQENKRSNLVESIIQSFFEIDFEMPFAKEVKKEMQNDVWQWLTDLGVSWTEFKMAQLGCYCLTKGD